MTPAADYQQQRRATDWVALAHQLGLAFAERAAAHDADDSFVTENYAELKTRGVFAAGVPAELGGGGASFAELCEMLRTIGRYCSSTALALAMHTHLVAGLVWRLRQGQSTEGMLRRVATERLVLVSTGASDWLESSGQAARAGGGYLVSGRKIFGSGSPAADVLMTSFPYDDPIEGSLVLHMPVPLTSPGVTVLDNWRTLGMRATGSNDVILDNVFVPESAVSLKRQRGVWHPWFTQIAVVPTTLITSVYLGVAEAAAGRACQIAAKKRNDTDVTLLVGEMQNHLISAQVTVQSMITLCDEYRFPVTEASASAQFARKTLATNAVLATVEKACEVVGGASYFRALGLERLLRDAHAGRFHPLQEKRQLLFTGRVALGLDPVR